MGSSALLPILPDFFGENNQFLVLFPKWVYGIDFETEEDGVKSEKPLRWL